MFIIISVSTDYWLLILPNFVFNLIQNTPYLCRKDGIVLHCPQVSTERSWIWLFAHNALDWVFNSNAWLCFFSKVKESPSLWENPLSATTSWKPCAERRDGGISGTWLFFRFQKFMYLILQIDYKFSVWDIIGNAQMCLLRMKQMDTFSSMQKEV